MTGHELPSAAADHITAVWARVTAAALYTEFVTALGGGQAKTSDEWAEWCGRAAAVLQVMAHG